MKKLEFHDAADLFPMMEATASRDFKAGIEKHSVQERVEVLDEKIVDGRNRYVACQELGVECLSVEIKTDDPVAYVLLNNFHRRLGQPQDHDPRFSLKVQPVEANKARKVSPEDWPRQNRDNVMAAHVVRRTVLHL